MLAALGFGGVAIHAVMTKLVEAYKKQIQNNNPPNIEQLLAKLKPRKSTSKSNMGILVEGEGGLMVRLAKCCTPVPGDTIIGYITRGRGVSVHRADCTNISINPEEFERMIQVEWDFTAENLYKVTVEITASDRSGLLSDIMMVISESKTKLSSVNAKVMKTKMAAITLDLEISSVSQLEHVMTKMRRVKDVYSVHRSAPNMGGV